ncbi:acetyl-coa acetyltransferase [Anaeramoeba flamelloides]|uniref:acetyl-CoA C-acetyltransferase n=1 Tax=Anaeramoeba flamelloides TaxID=1746091 RepID=A0ABQ8Z9I7_9EUKA|nr:acetyl-coa acetyltransferase [Anaeramoeba flamelloides]
MTNKIREVFIVSAVRTPIGAFGGSLSSLTAINLGSEVVKSALKKINLSGDQVDEVFFGNVLSAGLGQHPARQVCLKAGIPKSVPCTSVNKVCSSGLKSVMIGAQSIMLGDADLVVCGGMESMSNAPYYLENNRFNGLKFGDKKIVDGMIKDGLWDPINDYHMGTAGDLCAKNEGITREDLDDFAVMSYKRSIKARDENLLDDEITPITIVNRRTKRETVVSKDEELERFNEDKLRQLHPAFDRDFGFCTAGNSSSLDDGAACVIIASAEKCKELGLTKIAKIRAFADFAQEPEKFTTSPTGAIKKLLKKSNLQVNDIDSWEINEAFAVVPIAVSKQLQIPIEKVNQFGGAVAYGHPIGCSGARILVTLINVLKKKGGVTGVAAICNGGGGASSLLIDLC